ncbi:hypothetical protein GOP47_0007519 [Adiantum capillus-veneris]|uniref:Uncharacterized protein n=1 Tax=Adiantum capillus-veneris TaxID=13818 RepID=A0A9D4ZM08_ADICA|nr:hypothetical protein GOP47_0007519 [Adiantum capillus-veneris]
MGAAHSKKDGSSVYDDGSWTPANYSRSQRRVVKMYDPTEKTPRDISGPLGPVDLYGEDIAGEYNGYQDTPTPAPLSEKSKTTLKTKVFGVVGRAGTAGLGKAVGALDTIGSSMTNLNKGSGFTSAATIKANRIEILAFEVANTIAKGYSLKESLSKDSIKFLKEEVLCSYGVQRLVSTDMAELLSIAATDKKKELMVFAKEVVRFGNQCRDPQWHHLDRYFDKLGTERFVPSQDREEVEEEVQTLVLWAQQTGELYHELNSLDRFEAEIRRKLQDEDLYNNYTRGDNLSALRSELKARGKNVKMLKKKSLWSKTLEEVMEKLVDAVYFLYSEIARAFGDAGKARYEKSHVAKNGSCERLGPLGLALHYACIIGQIDGLVSRPGSLPVDTRDNLYQSLPPKIKGALRHRIPHYEMRHELTISHVKEGLERMLAWLVPIATNTTKAHHGFGWVGEWANTGSSLDVSLSAQTQFSLIQTLHHADRATTEECILELLVLLHYLVCLARDNVAEFTSSLRPSPSQEVEKTMQLDILQAPTAFGGEKVEQHFLNDAEPTNLVLERLPSREESSYILTKSDSRSSNRSMEDETSPSVNHVHLVPVVNLKLDRVKSLDIMDRVDDI